MHCHAIVALTSGTFGWGRTDVSLKIRVSTSFKNRTLFLSSFFSPQKSSGNSCKIRGMKSIGKILVRPFGSGKIDGKAGKAEGEAVM